MEKIFGEVVIGLELEVLLVAVGSQVIVAGVHVPMNVQILSGIFLARIRPLFESYESKS